MQEMKATEWHGNVLNYSNRSVEFGAILASLEEISVKE